MQAGSD